MYGILLWQPELRWGGGGVGGGGLWAHPPGPNCGELTEGVDQPCPSQAWGSHTSHEIQVPLRTEDSRL